MAKTGRADIIPYKIRTGDTLQRIAMDIIGDASRWIDIATFNKLQSPFIVNYKDVLGAQKATGTAVIYMESAPGGIISIPKYTIVATNDIVLYGSDISTNYQFVTQEEVFLSPSYFRTPVEVEAVEPGRDYNLAPGKLKRVLDDSLSALGVKAVNETAFTGGAKKFVVSPGDIIYIPLAGPIGSQTFNYEIPDSPQDISQWSQRILGTDLSLLPDPFAVQSLGEIANDLAITSKGDLKIVTGTPNLAQALTHRITTDKGELVGHPSYGSIIPQMIGSPETPKTSTVIGLEVKRTLLLDPRVDSVLSVNVSKSENTAFFAVAEVNVLGSESSEVVNLVMPEVP